MLSSFDLEGGVQGQNSDYIPADDFLQNEAKNIPRYNFMTISCKFEKASYNIFFRQRGNGEVCLHTAAAEA